MFLAAAEGAVWGAGGAMVVIMALIGLIVWFVKFVLPKLFAQNKQIIDGALDNMKANTDAIKANTAVTHKVVAALDKFVAVQTVQASMMQGALDRIERKVDGL